MTQMPLLPFVSFLLWFFLFATSSALTYLALRTWLHTAHRGHGGSVWRESLSAHARRAAGFACLTLSALVGAVSESGQGVRSFDLVSLGRIVAYILLFWSTPGRLRRRKMVGLAFASMLLGESLIILNFSHSIPLNSHTLPFLQGLVLSATLFMDIGIALIWAWYTRSVLRLRLTDKFTLAFVVFAIFLVLFVTLSIVAVMQTSLVYNLGLTRDDLQPAFQGLHSTIVLLFVTSVASSAIVSFFLARGMTAPVNSMSVAVRAIGKGERDPKIRDIRSRDEIQDLAHEIYVMARRVKEADELRAEFVAFASHELRNPLTAVKGFVQTLQMVDGHGGNGMTEQERSEIYDIVAAECDRLLRMTNELLESSRVEAGQPVALKLEQFDLMHEAENVIQLMRAQTHRHDLSLTGPEGGVSLEGDSDKFDQVLINLVSNAIKYSPRGGPVAILVKSSPNTVEVSVQDRGTGMSAENAERVFDKYYRIQDGGRGDQRAAGGAGLGLYLTRALVNAHGGNIRVESTLGVGSTFTVTLPRRQPTSSPVVAPSSPSETGSALRIAAPIKV